MTDTQINDLDDGPVGYDHAFDLNFEFVSKNDWEDVSSQELLAVVYKKLNMLNEQELAQECNCFDTTELDADEYEETLKWRSRVEKEDQEKKSDDPKFYIAKIEEHNCAFEYFTTILFETTGDPNEYLHDICKTWYRDDHEVNEDGWYENDHILFAPGKCTEISRMTFKELSNNFLVVL